MDVAERLVDVLERIDALNYKEEKAIRLKHDISRESSLKWLCIQHFNHLVEEVGEIAQCNRGKNEAPILEEAVDAAVCSLALAMLVSDGDIEDVVSMLEHKLNKWESYFDKGEF